MTIYLAFHLLYFMLHGQFLLRDLSAAPAGQWWKCALSWLAAEVISQLTIYYICWSIKRCDAMRSTEQKAKPEQQPSKEFEVLKEQLDAIQKDIGVPRDGDALWEQNRRLHKILYNKLREQQREEYGKPWLDMPNRTKPVTLEEVAQAYLDICDEACGGDDSAGVPPCQFYQRPDVDENGRICHGQCRLKSNRYKPG